MGAYLGSMYSTLKTARVANLARSILEYLSVLASSSLSTERQKPFNRPVSLVLSSQSEMSCPQKPFFPFVLSSGFCSLSFFISNCGYLELESFVLICHCHRSGQIWLSFWSLWVISFQTLTSHRHLLLSTSKPTLYHGSSLAFWQNYRLQMTYTFSLLCSIKSWSSLLLLLLKISLNLLLS